MNTNNITTKINQFISDPLLFISLNDINTLVEIANYTNNILYNSTHSDCIMSEDLFDFLLETIYLLDPTNTRIHHIGRISDIKNKITLPYHIAPIQKIKSYDAYIYTNWISMNKGPYIVRDKPDGISVLFFQDGETKNLFTCGDGFAGKDISNFIQYIPSLNDLIPTNTKQIVSGELIIPKKYLNQFNTERSLRNIVSSLINDNLLNLTAFKYISFVACELIYPWLNNFFEQQDVLSSSGFNIVSSELISTDINNYTPLLLKRKQLSIYNISGMIISSVKLPQYRPSDSSHLIIFNNFLPSQLITVTVNYILYTKNKVPRINFDPVTICNETITDVIAYNHNFIKKYNIREGSLINIVKYGTLHVHIHSII